MQRHRAMSYNGQFNREFSRASRNNVTCDLWALVVFLHYFLHYLDLPGMGMMSGLGLVVTAGANFVQTAVKPLSGWAKHDIRTPIHHQEKQMMQMSRNYKHPESRMVTVKYMVLAWWETLLYDATNKLINYPSCNNNKYSRLCDIVLAGSLSFSLWNHFLVSLSQKSLVICPCPRVDGKSGKPVSDPLCTLWIRSRQKSAGGEL